MEDNNIKQMTMRMTEGMYGETKKEADQIGSSHNSFLMVLIKLGLKVYLGDVTIQQKFE